ncbi:MAG: hypothetical protein ABSE47_07125 [Acidimicrobiales bacterium]
MRRAHGAGGDSVARRAPRVHRAVVVVVAVAGAWALGASLVPLAWTLGPAVRTGDAVRHLRGELVVLGTGWTGTIEAASSPDQRAGVLAWEWSSGLSATIRLQRAASALELELEPVGCPDRRAQIVTVHSPDTSADRTVALRGGFHWYSIPLGWSRGAGELSLSYRCVVASPATRSAHGPAQSKAVAVAGLELSG